MRISDWSSDVCSSDLTHPQQETVYGKSSPPSNQTKRSDPSGPNSVPSKTHHQHPRSTPHRSKEPGVVLTDADETFNQLIDVPIIKKERESHRERECKYRSL